MTPPRTWADGFDVDSDRTVFKADFIGSFGSLSFGNVASPGLSEDFLLQDLGVTGASVGGGIGPVDLIYLDPRVPIRILPEPISNVSFSPTEDQDSIYLDFGMVSVGADVPAIRFEVANLVTSDAGSNVDLVEIVKVRDSTSLNEFLHPGFDIAGITTDLATFTELAPNGTRTFQLNLDASLVGGFAKEWGLVLQDSGAERASQTLILTTHGTVVQTSQLAVVFDPKTGRLDFRGPRSPEGEPLDFVQKIEVISESGMFDGAGLELANDVARVSDRQLVVDQADAFGDVFLGTMPTVELDDSYALSDLTVRATMADGVTVDVNVMVIPEPSATLLCVVGLCGVFALVSSRTRRRIVNVWHQPAVS